MNDLIKRQDAIDAIMEDYQFDSFPDEYSDGYNHGLRSAERIINDLPSAEPEIIMCKDCRHNGSFDTDCPIDWNGKEYCSFAER